MNTQVDPLFIEMYGKLKEIMQESSDTKFGENLIARFHRGADDDNEIDDDGCRVIIGVIALGFCKLMDFAYRNGWGFVYEDDAISGKVFRLINLIYYFKMDFESIYDPDWVKSELNYCYDIIYPGGQNFTYIDDKLHKLVVTRQSYLESGLRSEYTP